MERLSNNLLDDILTLDAYGCVRYKEDNRYEYKSNIDWTTDSAKMKYLKELVALTNAGGGYLIFGIDDKTYQPTGLNAEKDVDLKLITDWHQKYFAPAIEISGRTFQKDGFDYFVVYSGAFNEIPCVAIKEREEIKNGCIYYRYSGKSEPIRGIDMIRLLYFLKKDSATYELILHNQETRKKDLQPKFYYDSGGSSDPERFRVNFSNKGARAYVQGVLHLKDSNGHVDRACGTPRFIEKGQGWPIFGRYRRSDLPVSQRTYKFRLYFTDEDEDWYFQEFEGHTGVVVPSYVKPVETSQSEMETFIEENK
jgi:hypothetical protein